MNLSTSMNESLRYGSVLIDAVEHALSPIERQDFSRGGVAPAPSDAIKRAIGLPVPHDKPDGLLERLRQDTQVREARQQGRRHCVNLHKLDFISRDEWVRQDRGCAGHC